MSTSDHDSMGTLVSAEWLERHLDAPDLVVLDCTVLVDVTDASFRNSSGRPAYEERHIPGAGFADLTGDLSASTQTDHSKPFDFALPSPEQFCQAMGDLGVGDDSRVVLYDANFTAWAARVWWMLRWVGFDQAALLDGGLAAWAAGDRPVSSEPVQNQPRTLTPKPRPRLIATRDEVRAAIEDGAVCVIDTLPSEHFSGDMAMYDRPGHITGAVNISGMDFFDESGRFRPDDELDALHTGDRSGRHITYCGGGILASANAYVMTRLGFDDVAVYAASLQEWAADPDNPMTVGLA